ncbi:hypothetical protein O6H91_17G055500 [Diphasiastrum complanatum]|uniref:Uncharacterized protein n=2 Tax=Diphasiastrum complanatum TaxID=34168 RepID=A0ACC2B6V8_DIPCM|nr:hypothetical protein O6H91_17G055500 [Diphasiastrum complanatum]
MPPRKTDGRGRFDQSRASGEYSSGDRGGGPRGYGSPQDYYNQPGSSRGVGRGQDFRYSEVSSRYGAPGGSRGGGRGSRAGRSGATYYERGGSYDQPPQYPQAERGRRGRGRGETFEATTQATESVLTPERLAARFKHIEIERAAGQEEAIVPESTSGEIPSDVAASLLPVVVTPTESVETSEASRETAPVSSKAIVAMSRPGLGINGDNVSIKVNHFKVELNVGTIYHYDVDIQPWIASKPATRLLISALVSSHKSVALANKLPVYDGRKSMYAAGPFLFDSKTFDVSLPDERGQKERERIFKVTIKLVAKLDRTPLNLFLKKKQTHMPQDFLQALDVVLREGPSAYYVPVGRSFFHDKLGFQKLDGGLVGWTGFYQSLRPTMQGLALNVDLSTTAFYEEMNVLDYLVKLLPRFNPSSYLGGAEELRVRNSLLRLQVEVMHRKTPRKYRIAGLSEVPTKDLKFDLDGQEVFLVDYFRNTYDYHIKFPELPSLLVQPNKATYLPMEVCKISAGQKFPGKLTDYQTTNMLRMASKKPYDREKSILDKLELDTAPGRDIFSKEFGLDISRKMTEVQARILNPPKLRYGGEKQNQVTPAKGQWNLMKSTFVEGARIENWALLDFSNAQQFKVQEFVINLTKRCADLGLVMNHKPTVPVRKARLDNNIKVVLKRMNDDARKAIGNGESARLQLIVCLMDRKTPLYGELKRVSETEIGIVTQCCLTKVLYSGGFGLSQYLANLAMKINVKAGGKNVTLYDELPRQLPNMFGVPTIIFGADVTHPVASDDSSPSIAAVVANVDWPSATKYVARVRSQIHREEIISDLAAMVRELLVEYYQKTNSRKPEKIIFFRDGVSEGQFYSVLHFEFNALLKACQSLEQNYRPKVTWVVVQKRHHTRFFPADNKSLNDNVWPGTVVDRVITHPREFDFYLCSHAGIQGTSRPTHYHILWDENQFKPDELQGLINSLCYTYARCTKAVSIVPPAYYAHLAAYRARLYVDGSGSGSDTTSLRGDRSGVSVGSASSSRAAIPAVQLLPTVQKCVQSVMYYC